ncbi:MAG TPA: hypothetical protein ENN40_10505 [Candidatus Aminicenantes bacterium]|nr:hypothetical protein [Candidatus Aminicenantes bacterium]
MKIKWMMVVMLTALLMAAAPLAANDGTPAKEGKQETYRKAILEQAKLDINVFKEQLKGGRADGKAVTDFPLEQLIKGIETEMEHTKDPMLALEIAMDHLEELDDYYTRLEVMEHGHCKMMARGMMKMKAHKCAMHKDGKAAEPCKAEAEDKATTATEKTD